MPDWKLTRTRFDYGTADRRPLQCITTDEGAGATRFASWGMDKQKDRLLDVAAVQARKKEHDICMRGLRLQHWHCYLTQRTRAPNHRN